MPISATFGRPIHAVQNGAGAGASHHTAINRAHRRRIKYAKVTRSIIALNSSSLSRSLEFSVAATKWLNFVRDLHRMPLSPVSCARLGQSELVPVARSVHGSFDSQVACARARPFRHVKVNILLNVSHEIALRICALPGHYRETDTAYSHRRCANGVCEAASSSPTLIHSSAIAIGTLNGTNSRSIDLCVCVCRVPIQTAIMGDRASARAHWAQSRSDNGEHFGRKAKEHSR